MRRADQTLLEALRQAVIEGAGAQDIHDAPVTAGFAAVPRVTSSQFIERELGRVELHLRSLVGLLAPVVGRVPRVLDVGCSTGGSTVALALAPTLGAEQVVGVDTSGQSIEAARLRAKAYGLESPAVRFQTVEAGAALPFAADSFDLVTCVSVLEFVTTAPARELLCGELERVVTPGGYVYVATPRPALREYHSHRWLGDVRRNAGFPWSSPPWQLARLLPGERVALGSAQLRGILDRRGLGWLPVPSLVAELAAAIGPWQKRLVRRAG